MTNAANLTPAQARCLDDAREFLSVSNLDGRGHRVATIRRLIDLGLLERVCYERRGGREGGRVVVELTARLPKVA